MRRWGLVLFLPVGIFLLLFAVIPAVGMLIDSVSNRSGLTLSFYRATLQGQYLAAFWTTSALSLVASLIATAWGAVVTWHAARLGSPWIQQLITAFTSMMGNFAGLPLAVAFMATLGTSGIVTVFLEQVLHLSLSNLGWNLASLEGLGAAYLSFLVPLSIVLLLPAFSSLAQEWEEAVYTLGGSRGVYLRDVAIPTLLPSLVGTLALLFANAFSTYVTAYELTGGSINLIPIQIGYLVDGNVSLNLGLGDALAVEEMLVLALAVGIFLLAQRVSRVRGVGERGRIAA